jgi:ABC-type nitrate/sulfonate/bicarbonate transport system substrate-binding protein
MKNQNKEQLPSDTFKKKFIFWIGIIVAAVLVVIVYYFSSNNSSEFHGDKEKVTLGISRSFLSIPVYIAKKKGYFSDEGIDITVKEYSSGKIATKSMFAGEVDISTMADMPVVFNSFKRQDFCVFATFTTSYHFVSMLTREDTGIKTGTDLRGKRIGANRGTSSHFYLAVFLADNQLSMSDVQMIHYKTVDLPDALKNHEVDAISVWQPHAHNTGHLLKDNIKELPSLKIYRTTFNFGAKKNYAKSHQKTLEKFIKALIRASNFIQNNKDESQEIITEWLKIEKETVSKLWDGYSFKINLDQALLVSWDDIGRWSIANHFTDNKMIPNYLNYICLDALEEVDPISINIIR